jgi:hypothetical protein
VTDFLEGLRKSYPYFGAATEGAQAIFGRIYQVLEFGREDASYDAEDVLCSEWSLLACTSFSKTEG